MLYANVVLGLPIEGPFDYLVPIDLENKPQGNGLASNSQSHKPQGNGLPSNSQSHKPQGNGLASNSQSHKPQGNGLPSVRQSHKISVGMRVWVNFRNKKEVAYVVGLSNKTKIKRIKEISAVIDRAAVLDEKMLLLTKELAEYYCCSWGEAIKAALPEELRKGKETRLLRPAKVGLAMTDRTVAHLPAGRQVMTESGWTRNDEIASAPTVPRNDGHLFLQGQERMPVYLREIKEAWAAKRSAIVLFSDIPEAERAKELIEKDLGVEVFVVFRKQPKELETWEKIRQAEYCIVAGTRSSIFSCVNNLGLIIIDQEQEQVYKQEQVPHYHAREAALMRAEIQGAKLILGSHCLSLESFYLAQKEKLEFKIIPSKAAYPQVKVIDLRRLAYTERKSKSIFSKFLTDAIYATLGEKGKILLVINRKGFATCASCHNCGASLKCPRCNINLVFHFDEDKLKCHHCNFKMEVPKICPSCNAGYIKYSGIGTEKVESELARIFPQAAVKILEEQKGNVNLPQAGIFVATGSVVKQRGILSFDLIGVLAIDNLLNRVDFRAAEKTFSLLTGLVSLSSKKIIIQSANANHYCFQALIKNDRQLFYAEELKQRKQLNFAPFKHMILVKLRGASLEKIKKASADLFQRLNNIKISSIKILSLNPGQPAKLRGNFYYQILMRAASAKKASHFLKLQLKEWHYSGIIVTVDIDPI